MLGTVSNCQRKQMRSTKSHCYETNALSSRAIGIINFIFGKSFDLCTAQFYCVRVAFEKLSTQHPLYSLRKWQVQDPRFRTVDEAFFTHLQLFQGAK